MAHKWLLRFVTLAAWLAASASATYWSLKFAGASQPPVKATEIAASTPREAPADLARLFGPPVVAPSAAPSAAASAAPSSAPQMIDPGARFALVGVVANQANAGVALIAVDGKAARPYRVGSQIEDSHTLKSVALRSATLTPLAQPDALLTLELAAPVSAASAATASAAAVAPITRAPGSGRNPKPAPVRELRRKPEPTA